MEVTPLNIFNYSAQFASTSQKTETKKTDKTKRKAFESAIEQSKAELKLKEEGFEVYYICIFRKESLPKFVIDGFYPYNKNDMEVIKKKYHADRSEYEWCKCNPKFFAVIKNDGTIQDLENQIEEKLISKIFA